MDQKKTIKKLRGELRQRDQTIASLLVRIAELEEKIASLEKNSQTSHKPPSTDIVKPQKKNPKQKSKRKIGAQKGHQQNLRTPFPPEKVDTVIDLHVDFDLCPECNGKLASTDEPPKITQQMEIPPVLIHVTEYRQHYVWCRHCNTFQYQPLAKEVAAGGLFGPRLTATIGYFKGRCHLSYTSIRDFCSDVLGFDVSRGYIAKTVRKVSNSLADAHAELESQLPHEKRLNIDESGLKKNGVMQWAWVFVASTFVYYCVSASRASQVLFDKLGKTFGGSITSDFHSLYKKFGRETPAMFQFCWAHLIRDIKFMIMTDDAMDTGNCILKKVKSMFETIRDKNKYSERKYLILMREHERKILDTIERNVPEHRLSLALEERMDRYGEDYFRFIELGIDPTNNESERMFRLLIIDRLVTQGTRSDWGDRWHERFWTSYATCQKQGVNIMEFLRSSVKASFCGEASPSLLSSDSPESS